MNNKEWADNPEFWYDEQHGEDDEDEYNGHDNDVDANNDETFDNAAEWNEDEHEELIARDMILSHKPAPPKQPIIQHQTFQQPPTHQPQIFTVDELERQFFRTSINQTVAAQARIPRAQPETSKRAGWTPFGGRDLFTRDDDLGSSSCEAIERDLYKHTVSAKKTVAIEQCTATPFVSTGSHTENRNHRRKRNDDNRDSFHNQYSRRDGKNTHKENHRLHRREPIIIPPQVQLSVISKAKRRHSITAMHQDEFIRDRMPASGEGFRFLRHSQVASNRVKHDGVLTDKERDWLTRIQEKIQADYDNNLDQDYYYLLYFNRSSMTDEAAQKPMGHGVLDRRFIPRERLLYNSGV